MLSSTGHKLQKPARRAIGCYQNLAQIFEYRKRDKGSLGEKGKLSERKIRCIEISTTSGHFIRFFSAETQNPKLNDVLMVTAFCLTISVIGSRMKDADSRVWRMGGEVEQSEGHDLTAKKRAEDGTQGKLSNPNKE